MRSVALRNTVTLTSCDPQAAKMSIDFGHDGFDYTRDLCDAIERYTNAVLSQSPKGFHYRGLDLLPAIQRLLYIHCINSVALFERYRNRPSSRSQLQLNTLDDLVAPFLVDAPAIPRCTRPSHMFHVVARRIYGLVRERLQRRVERAKEVTRNQILFHIGNQKFVRYLNAITNELTDHSYAFLTTGNACLAEQLQQQGRPSIHWPDRGATFQSVTAARKLAPFEPLVHEADRLIEAIHRLQPACVVVVEGNAPADALMAEVCRKLGVPCYCIQQGWSPYIHTGFRNMRFTEMLVWGQLFADMLRPFNPGQQFRITGSHILARSAASSDAGNLFSFFLQAPCALLGHTEFEAFVTLAEDIAALFPSAQFVVREHPGYPLQAERKRTFNQLNNVRFSDPAHESLSDLISRSALVISVFSTVLLEALALDVPSLICSIGAMKRYQPEIAAEGAALEVSSIDEAREALSKLISTPNLLDEMKQRIPAVKGKFFSPGTAAQTISSILESTVSGTADRQPGSF